MTVEVARSANNNSGPTPWGEPPETRGLFALLTRIAAAVAGAITFYVGLTNWGRGQVYVYREIALMGLVTYMLAFALLVLALVRIPVWTRRVGLFILIAIAYTTFASTYVWIQSVHRTYGTDVIAFQHYAAKLTLRGINPYTVSMLPALKEFDMPGHLQTPTFDGSVVDRVSWPAGSFLLFVPFVALNVSDLRWVVLLFQLAVIGLVYGAAPKHLRPFVLLPVLVAQDLVDLAGGGSVDFPWVLFILVMIIWRDRPILAGVCYGLASAFKQQPWLLAPFLVVYYLSADTDSTLQRRLGKVVQFAVSALGLFLALNGPFIVQDPRSWALGTLTPILGNLVPAGSGLSMITQIGLPLPTEYYTLVATGIAFLLVVNYAVHFDVLREAMWLFPAIIIWFSPRSLHSYFVYWIPAIALALARRGTNAGAIPSTSFGRSVHVRFWVPKVSLALLALLLVLPAVYLNGRTPWLPIRIEALAMEDPLRIGAVTRLVLKITNTGFAEIRPVFSVSSSVPFPVGWKRISGPDSLAPRSTAVYAIEADALEKAIPAGDRFVIRVNHSRGRLFAASRPLSAALKERIPLVNDAFRHWILDVTTGERRPVGWEVAGIGGPIGRTLNVVRADVGGRSALTYQITHDGKVPGWRGIHVRQRIEDPQAVAQLFAEGFGIWVYPTYDYSSNSGGWPLNVFGIEVNTDDRLLWIVFSNKGTGWYALPNHAIAVLRAPLGQWSYQRVDLQNLYNRLGWPRPERLTFILLAGTTADRPGTFAPAFGGIDLVAFGNGAPSK